LNLGESLSPVLIAKVQHGAPHPQNVLEKFANTGDESEGDFGPDLESSFDSDEEDLPEQGAWMGDIEWIAFEVFQDEEEADEEEDAEDDSEGSDITSDLLQGMSALKLDSGPATPPLQPLQADQHASLSLLEYLLRLAALQTFEQQSHMHLTDEHIVLFLRDNNPASRIQAAAIDDEHTIRHQSSQTSISSDFNTRLAAHRNVSQQLPISPPHSEDNHKTSPDSGAGVSPSPMPSSPVNRNPRTYLEHAMAADYDPMTLVTPLSNRRITRNNHHKQQHHRKKSPLVPVKRGNTTSATTAGGAAENSKPSSAPNSLQRQFPAPKIGKDSRDDHDSDKNNLAGDRDLLASPLVGKQGSLPQRRVVSLRQRNKKNGNA